MALILTRRPRETLVVTTPGGEQIRVTVVAVRGIKVIMRIDANVNLNVRSVEKRLLDQSLFIDTPSGEQIEVIILRIRSCQVDIATNADRSVVVDREEIHQRKLAEAAAA